MCGIAGIVTFGELDVRSLSRMSEALAHRGPDGEGFLLTDLAGPLRMTRGPVEVRSARPVVAFAHRRLAIIDPSPENDQPLVDSSGELAIVFNGEIYNYRELRAELESLGHRFRTVGDTEVALLAYAQWGVDCAQRFIGMWAFAICDRPRRQLVLSRDRFGIKPLYLTADSRRLLFASEIKGLVASGLIRPSPNELVVARYLVGGELDADDQTFFADIRQFPAATTAVVSLQRSELVIRPARYWSLPRADTGRERTRDLGIVVGEVRASFEDSLRLHLRSDVAIGTCLSGGVDSSGIVCVANGLRAEDGSAYSHKGFGYLPPEPELSERRYMEAVARRCGVEMTYAQPTEAEFQQALEQVVVAQDEPFGSASIAAQWFVFAAAARSGLKVMLDGQGADEVFGGYHHYLRLIAQDHLLNGRWYELARFMRDAAAATGASPYPRWIVPAALLPLVVKRRARAALITRAAARAPVSRRLRDLAGDVALRSPAELDADAILRADVERGNLPALLRYEDRNAMAHSIEARVPYLDHRLVEAAFRLPAATRMARAQPKWILREALREALPPVVLERRDKMAFQASPRVTWSVAHALREQLAGRDDGPVAEWLSPCAVRALLERPSSRFEDELCLWRAVNVQLWARQVWG